MEGTRFGRELIPRWREEIDGRPDPAFDRLTPAASRLLEVPMALVSLVDDERQVFMSAMGLPEEVASVGETPLIAFLLPRDRRVVRAADRVRRPRAPAPARQPRDRRSRGDRLLRFPLFIGRETVGAFCAIDTRPHDWTESELELVRDLAAMAQTGSST